MAFYSKCQFYSQGGNIWLASNTDRRLLSYSDSPAR